MPTPRTPDPDEIFEHIGDAAKSAAYAVAVSRPTVEEMRAGKAFGRFLRRATIVGAEFLDGDGELPTAEQIGEMLEPLRRVRHFRHKLREENPDIATRGPVAPR